MAAEDPAGLLGYYRDSLQERNDDMMLRFFYGKFCLRVEMVEEALEHLSIVESVGIDSPQLQLLLAEAHRRRHRNEEALNAYKKALGVNIRLRFGYVCDSCGEDAAEWQSRCPSCGAWGSFSIAGRQSLRNAHPLELRPIHHGEREAWRLE
jgi:lipopolysaccharide biosynthesis regulator YciM